MNVSKTAIVIPAYNEEDQIALVLDVVTVSPVADEILVINDASTDNTEEVVKKYPGVKLINRKANGGKGAALMTALEETSADILLSVDADLLGLKEKHLKDLLRPLLEDNEVVMTIGKFKSGRLRTDLSQKITPFLSGQRCMRRSFLENAGDLSQTRYGLEIALTRRAKECGAKVEEIVLSDASHVMKEEKLGILRGILARIEMYRDILRHLFSLFLF